MQITREKAGKKKGGNLELNIMEGHNGVYKAHMVGEIQQTEIGGGKRASWN